MKKCPKHKEISWISVTWISTSEQSRYPKNVRIIIVILLNFEIKNIFGKMLLKEVITGASPTALAS